MLDPSVMAVMLSLNILTHLAVGMRETGLFLILVFNILRGSSPHPFTARLLIALFIVSSVTHTW